MNDIAQRRAMNASPAATSSMPPSRPAVGDSPRIAMPSSTPATGAKNPTREHDGARGNRPAQGKPSIFNGIEEK